MTDDPQMVPRNALAGRRVAVSVSDSADLHRLGLSQKHLDLTVAELSRAIVIAGATVVYGGGISHGFTQIVLEEAERYGNRSGAFEHFVPYTEHADLPSDQLTGYAASLGVKSTVRLLDADGAAHPVADAQAGDFARHAIEPDVALTAMRTLTTEVCDARVVVGGKVSGFKGAMPGVAEEAALTVREGKPIYIAGGFGGAATLVGSIVAPEMYQWLPPDLPAGLSPEIRDLVSRQVDLPLPEDGLVDDQRAVLAATHRPSDIATLVVLGLSRHLRGDSK